MDEKTLKQAKDIIKTRHDMAVEKREADITAKCKNNDEYNLAVKKLKQNILNLSKALAKGENIEEFENVDKLLKQNIHEIEYKLGIKENYFFCPTCKDTGQLKDGSYCNCLIEAYRQIMRQKSGVNDLPSFTFKDNNIKNINCNQNKLLSKLYSTMEKYCNEFPNNKVNKIFLTGKVGVGKSCLLSATANKLIDRGFDVQYLTAFKLNNVFLKYHTTDAKERQPIMDTLINADMLIIDDLGTEPIIKNVSIEYLICLLDARINKHTIISTNLTHDELESRYAQRIVSRLENTTAIYYLDGDDLRRK